MELTGHLGVGKAERPDEGSISICWNCASIAIYTEPDGPDGILGLRAPTAEELEKLRAAPEIANAVRAVIIARTNGMGRDKMMSIYERLQRDA